MYSKDLSILIGLMLKTNPLKRISCYEIFKNELVQKRINLLMKEKEYNKSSDIQAQLLSTIKLPWNINDISQRLPKKMYVNPK